jgi:DNA-binding Lrp family transcriptional regulator
MERSVGPLSLKVIRELCTNSRVSLSEMERKLGSPRYLLSRHIRRLEEELGLRYTLEIDYTKLGLSKINVLHFSFSEKPSRKFIKEVADSSEIVQLAITTKGKDFDLVMFITPRNTEEYAKWVLALFLKFSRYGVAPSVSYIDIMHLGFMPLNDWAINSSDIKEIYKRMLVALNGDSRQSIRALSGKLGIGEDLTRYYMLKLEELGIIKKFTTIITRTAPRVNIILFANYVFREGYVNRVLHKRLSVYFKKDDPLQVCNEYQMVTTMSGAEYDLVWGAYKTEKEAKSNCVQLHESIFEKDSPSIRYGYVDGVVKGFMPIRSIEIKDNYVSTTWVEE